MRRCLIAIPFLAIPAIALANWMYLPGPVYSTHKDEVSTETSLNTSHAYGANTLASYLFNEESGATVYDYTGSADGTIGGTATRVSGGVQIDSTNENVTIPVPSFGSAYSIVIVAKSPGSTGQGSSSGLSRLLNNTSLDIMRASSSDLNLDFTTNSVTVSYTGSIDLWDNNTHVIVLTVDTDTHTRKVYIDGGLKVTNTTTFTAPTWSGTMYIGNSSAGTREGMLIFGALYFYNYVLDSTAVSSISSSPYQMFNNPPTR